MGRETDVLDPCYGKAIVSVLEVRQGGRASVERGGRKEVVGGVGESEDGGEAFLKKDFAPVDGRGSLGNPKHISFTKIIVCNLGWPMRGYFERNWKATGQR